MKKWYTYTRNEIIYVQFKDRRAGKKLTAKSTGTRIKSEAEYIIQRGITIPTAFLIKGRKILQKIFCTILSEIRFYPKPIYVQS